ncbi:hypothetical protein AHAS_Ahas19G0110200 [Arachis hypogaea]
MRERKVEEHVQCSTLRRVRPCRCGVVWLPIRPGVVIVILPPCLVVHCSILPLSSLVRSSPLSYCSNFIPLSSYFCPNLICLLVDRLILFQFHPYTFCILVQILF